MSNAVPGDDGRRRQAVLNMQVDAVDLDRAVARITRWAASRQAAYVCVANVHMCIECLDDTGFAQVVNGADMVVADGWPIALAMRLLAGEEAGHVRGTDLTRALLERAERDGLVVGFYGGTEQALQRIRAFIGRNYPALSLGSAISPPFRPLSEEEQRSDIERINAADVQILFVGLGCPKQENWMAANVKSLNAVLIGVGAAFDFLSGQKKTAPVWMQSMGLEWVFRLASEPRRLWQRYLTTNPRFLWHFAGQYLRFLLDRAGER